MLDRCPNVSCVPHVGYGHKSLKGHVLLLSPQHIHGRNSPQLRVFLSNIGWDIDTGPLKDVSIPK
jgi:hypothetical protein